jgi:hypothetical protein
VRRFGRSLVPRSAPSASAAAGVVALRFGLLCVAVGFVGWALVGSSRVPVAEYLIVVGGVLVMGGALVALVAALRASAVEVGPAFSQARMGAYALLVELGMVLVSLVTRSWVVIAIVCCDVVLRGLHGGHARAPLVWTLVASVLLWREGLSVAMVAFLVSSLLCWVGDVVHRLAHRHVGTDPVVLDERARRGRADGGDLRFDLVVASVSVVVVVLGVSGSTRELLLVVTLGAITARVVGYRRARRHLAAGM